MGETRGRVKGGEAGKGGGGAGKGVDIGFGGTTVRAAGES